MKFDITVERQYPHPIETVWKALTTRSSISVWLMESDFEPRIGQAFTMRCDNPEGGTDVFACRVLELEPMVRMLWSWTTLDDAGLESTFVEFRVRTVRGGTSLRIRHYGHGDPSFVSVFESGWPGRLDDIGDLLDD